jgi:hypothetical protein
MTICRAHSTIRALATSQWPQKNAWHRCCSRARSMVGAGPVKVLDDGRRETGRCARCGAPAAKGPRGFRSLCEHHLAYAANKRAERAAALRKAGRCVDCGAPISIDRGVPRCIVCHSLRCDLQNAPREGDRCGCGALKERRRALCATCHRRARSEREAAVKQGLCAWLCGQVAMTGRKICEAHWRALKGTSPRPCSRNCGRPAVGSRSLCEDCTQLRERAKRSR